MQVRIVKRHGVQCDSGLCKQSCHGLDVDCPHRLCLKTRSSEADGTVFGKFCGIFRKQSITRGSASLEADPGDFWSSLTPCRLSAS